MLLIALDIERLARRVAAERGSTPEEIVREAVEEHARKSGVEPRETAVVDLAKIDAITRRSAGRSVLDDRNATDILDEAWPRARV